MNKQLHNVFVYGTLKRKFWNHHVLHTGKAELVGRGETTEKFVLFNGGFPKMARIPRGISAIRTAEMQPFLGHVEGEVWRIDDESLIACDRLEGHPRFYCREKLGIHLVGGDKRITAWGYVITDFPFYDIAALMTPIDGVLAWDENTKRSIPDVAWHRDEDKPVLRGKVLARDRKR